MPNGGPHLARIVAASTGEVAGVLAGLRFAQECDEMFADGRVGAGGACDGMRLYLYACIPIFAYSLILMKCPHMKLYTCIDLEHYTVVDVHSKMLSPTSAALVAQAASPQAFCERSSQRGPPEAQRTRCGPPTPPPLRLAPPPARAAHGARRRAGSCLATASELPRLRGGTVAGDPPMDLVRPADARRS